MLNTKKLLYILPDVAYVAELLPTKKEHTFAIQSFRQINGEFMTEEDDFIADNIEKLFSKLEADAYHVILPDFLFTNTIVEVKEIQENKVKAYIKDQLLPNLGLTKESHEIDTYVLNQYNNISKIQLTALEKGILNPLITASQAHKIEVAGLSPLTWTIKSMISLEPSISVIQIGTMLYVAEHYIGVDQCAMAKVEEIENVGETIKTLKGAQPSIQTIYLLTNDLVEDTLKRLVSNTIPVQQLSTGETADGQLPNYVKNIIESGMKTLDIVDFPVPHFALPKAATSSHSAEKEESGEEVTEPTEDTSEIATSTAQDDVDTEQEVDLKLSKDSLFADSEELDETLPPLSPPPVFGGSVGAATAAASSTVVSPVVSSDALSEDEIEKPLIAPVTPVTKIEADDIEADDKDETESETTNIAPVDTKLESLFSHSDSDSDSDDTSVITSSSVSSNLDHSSDSAPLVSNTSFGSVTTTKEDTLKLVIKNKAASSTTRMFLLMLGVFVVTVIAGIGVGLGILKLTEGSSSPVSRGASPSPSTSAIAIPSPAATASPAASPSASLRQGKTILVVNATTKAGYAGTIKTRLETAGFTGVKSANAKGDYEEGDYVLMTEKDQALIDLLTKDSELELVFSDKIATEDAKGEFDAVIVLGQ